MNRRDRLRPFTPHEVKQLTVPERWNRLRDHCQTKERVALETARRCAAPA